MRPAIAFLFLWLKWGPGRNFTTEEPNTCITKPRALRSHRNASGTNPRVACEGAWGASEAIGRAIRNDRLCYAGGVGHEDA